MKNNKVQNRRQSLLIVSIVIIIFLAIAFFGAMLGSGSYGYAEQYKFDVTKKQLISTIENFKNKNQSFVPPVKYGSIDTLDTLTTKFFISIYFQNEDTIVDFFIDSSPNGTDESYINLVSVNQGLHSPVYKLINKDFDRNENRNLKKEFEERVLNKLNIPYEDKGNGNFIFWK